MFESGILPSLIAKLNFWTKNCSMNCGWLKETFWQLCDYIHGLDKYNIHSVLKCEESLIRIKLTLKFHKGCNFAGRFLVHLFFLLIFLLSFLVNLTNDWLIHSSYNTIDRIIIAEMNDMENWNYILFGHALLGLTLNLVK